jgi:hypothetical protein
MSSFSQMDAVQVIRFYLCGLVAVLIGISCCQPFFWGRGGFLEGGTELPGWAVVMLPGPCCMSWPSIFAFWLSAIWIYWDEYRGAFILSCLNLLPTAIWLIYEEPGRFELRSGYYFWLAAAILWAVGIGWLRFSARRDCQALEKPKTAIDELEGEQEGSGARRIDSSLFLARLARPFHAWARRIRSRSPDRP